jgi:hypothetical protein
MDVQRWMFKLGVGCVDNPALTELSLQAFKLNYLSGPTVRHDICHIKSLLPGF